VDIPSLEGDRTVDAAVETPSDSPLRRELKRRVLPKLHPDKATGVIQREAFRQLLLTAVHACTEAELWKGILRLADACVKAKGGLSRVDAYIDVMRVMGTQ
jgi:hypothetical protein